MANQEVFITDPQQALYSALVNGRLEEVKDLLSADLGLDIHRIAEGDKWNYLHYVSKYNSPPQSIMAPRQKR